MVDIHSHILPEVDDGARSWEMAVHMCHMAAQDGITHMVATPHSNHEYLYDRQMLEELLGELHTRIGKIIDLSLGCDFHFSYENLVEFDQAPERFIISDTKYMLIELSDYSIPSWVTGKFDELLASGIHPIITHPERNMLLQKRPEQVLDWAQMGCPVQLTANSLTGNWGEKASRAAHWLLQKEAVHVVATDAHNVEGRPPVLSKAAKVLTKTYGADVAQALTTDNPLAVVENRPLPYFPG